MSSSAPSISISGASRKAINGDERPDLIPTVRSAGYATDADGATLA